MLLVLQLGVTRRPVTITDLDGVVIDEGLLEVLVVQHESVRLGEPTGGIPRVLTAIHLLDLLEEPVDDVDDTLGDVLTIGAEVGLEDEVQSFERRVLFAGQLAGQFTPSEDGDWGSRAGLHGGRIVPDIGLKVKLKASPVGTGKAQQTKSS